MMRDDDKKRISAKEFFMLTFSGYLAMLPIFLIIISAMIVAIFLLSLFL